MFLDKNTWLFGSSCFFIVRLEKFELKFDFVFYVTDTDSGNG